jgi:hypothetical protein
VQGLEGKAGLEWIADKARKFSVEAGARIDNFMYTVLNFCVGSAPSVKVVQWCERVAQWKATGRATGQQAPLFCTLTRTSTRSASSVFCDGVNLSHVFEGEINASGRAVGFHHLGDGTLSAGKARVDRIVTAPDINGFYKAEISVFDSRSNTWIPKTLRNGTPGFSTMWPNEWKPQEVFDEIYSAFANARVGSIPGQPSNYWEGISARGFKIGGYLTGARTLNPGDLNTAFPII